MGIDGGILSTRNPRTGEIDGSVPVFSKTEVAQTAAVLRQNQTTWLNLGVAQRAQYLLQLADAFVAHKDALVAALVADTGRLNESVLEVDSTVGAMRRWATIAPDLLAPPAAKNASIPFISIQQHVRPYALAGIISPWNFPLLLSMIDAYPALMAGCAVLIKPSEITSRFVAAAQAAINTVPTLAHVLAFATGGGSTGSAVVEHVDVLCFTGSVATGKKVGVQAAQAFIPAHLELGGKDAALVFATANIARAARAIAWASMVNAGQSCMSLERCYVERAVFDTFCAALTTEVKKLKHAWPTVADGQIGPVISAAQVAIIQAHLDDAFAQGATALVGGKLLNLGGGWWCEPTVLVNTHNNMAVVAQETFAPILPVMPFDSEDEAIEAANSTEFGLSAAVFSADLPQAHRVAGQLQAGAISINDASLTALIHEGAKQSFKHSGLGGSRMGTASLQRFYRQQVFLQNNGVDSPWWFGG